MLHSVGYHGSPSLTVPSARDCLRRFIFLQPYCHTIKYLLSLSAPDSFSINFSYRHSKVPILFFSLRAQRTLLVSSFLIQWPRCPCPFKYFFISSFVHIRDSKQPAKKPHLRPHSHYIGFISYHILDPIRYQNFTLFTLLRYASFSSLSLLFRGTFHGNCHCLKIDWPRKQSWLQIKESFQSDVLDSCIHTRSKVIRYRK